MSERYQIKHEASGGVFEVRAGTPEEAIQMVKDGWQTLPRLIWKDEAGARVFERSNGKQYAVSPNYSTSDPEAIAKIMAEGAGAASRSSINKDIIANNTAAAFANEYARGTIFAGSEVDEVIGKAFGDTSKAGARALTNAMQQERPWTTFGLNLAGGAASTASLAGVTPQFVTAPVVNYMNKGGAVAKALKAGLAGAVGGGVEGGVYGYGEGTDPASRIQKAIEYGAIGTVAGGTLGLASIPAKAAFGNIAKLFKRSDLRTISKNLGISKDAAKVIKHTFDAGGGIDDAVAKLRQAGGTGMIADGGPAAQALLDAAMAHGGAAATAGREAIDGRVIATSDAARTVLNDNLGEAALGPKTAVANIQAKSRDARTLAYDKALGKPIDYNTPAGANIADTVSRVPADTMEAATKNTNAEILARRLDVDPVTPIYTPQGNVSPDNRFNMTQLNELKKSLDSAAQGAREVVTNRDTAESLRNAMLAKELRDEMVKAVPDYGPALQIGGDTIRERDAFTLATKILAKTTTVEDVYLMVNKNPSADKLAAARSGLRTAIDQLLGDVKALPSRPDIDANQAITMLKSLSSDNVRAKMRLIMGDAAEGIFTELDQAMNAVSLQAATARNSATAARLAQKETIDAVTSPSILDQAAQGELMNSTKGLLKAVTGQTDEYTAAQKSRIYADIVKALTESRGEDAALALQALNQAVSQQAISDTQMEMLARVITLSIYGGGTSAATTGMGSGM